MAASSGAAAAGLAVSMMPIAAMLASMSLSSIGSNAPTKIAKSSADLKHEQEVAKLKRKADFMSKRREDLGSGENAAQTRAAEDAFAASEEAQDKEDARALAAVEDMEAKNEKKAAPAADAAAAPAASAAAEAATDALADVPMGPEFGAEARSAALAEQARMSSAAAEAEENAKPERKDRFWKAVNYGLENKNRRLDDAIMMGTKNPELLTMLYGERPLPLLVQVIQIAKTKAVNDDIQTFTGDLLGREKRAANKAEAEAARVRTARNLVRGITRRQKGGAQTTDLEKFTQMILNRIITESATEQSISLQAADAFAELVKYENPKNNDKIAKYLAGVFSQFMKIKKDGKKTPTIVADVLFETMTPTEDSEFTINRRLLDQKSWLVFQNELKADPRVVIALKEEADEKDAQHIRKTATRYIAALRNLEANKGDSSVKKEHNTAYAAYLPLNDMKKGPRALAAMTEILKEVEKVQEELDTAREANAKLRSQAQSEAKEVARQADERRGDEDYHNIGTAPVPAAAAAEEANTKAREAEAAESAKRREVLTRPTAEELRKQADEEQARNAAAAAAAEIQNAEERAARVNDSDNQNEVRQNRLDKRGEKAAAEEAKAAAAAEEANTKAREAEAAESAKRREVLTRPTAEELRKQADEERARNAAAAAAAEAAEKAKATAAAAAAALLARAPHNLRRREPLPQIRSSNGQPVYRPLNFYGVGPGGRRKRRTPKRRRKLRKSTFRRHRKH